MIGLNLLSIYCEEIKRSSIMILDLIRPHLKDMEGYSSAGMEAGKDASKLFLNAN